MESFISRSIRILLAVGLGYELAASEFQFVGAEQFSSQGSLNGRLLDKCCQIGRERAIESAKFNCKLAARDALISLSQAGDRASQLFALSADSLLARDANLGDQCEMVLESCCLAHHRTRNCNSGKQFAKSGSACMDVELSKEATVATESFNDCCMSCSLGILAARTGPSNDTSGQTLSDRCKLISPLASSLSGQLYEQTYDECCQENLPRPSSALNFNQGGQVDCSQVANVCSQRCIPAGAQDPITRRPVAQDRCDCFSGYKLAQDGVSCLDIDECKLNLHTCNKLSEVCDNTRGSFRCLARSQQQQNQQHFRQSQGRSLVFDDQPQDQAVSSLVGEQPFASYRLCPLGSRWLAVESRCVSTTSEPANAGNHHHQQQQQQQWKRNAAYQTSSSSSSSSRRVAHAD